MRDVLATAFLETTDWANAQRSFLAGDASDRSYQRLRLGTKTAVLMDAPPGTADDPANFAHIATHLRHLGISAPAILGSDFSNGFLVIEDLGDGLYTQLIAENPAMELPMYLAATDVLIRVAQGPAPSNLACLTAQDWAHAACFALDWYAFGVTSDPVDTGDFRQELMRLLHQHANAAPVTILRDYHADNLLWLPARKGLARVGVLDFQLAQLGQPGYDLVSLLQDARRDVSHEVQQACIDRFVAQSEFDAAEFERAYAVLGVQRALRIMGVFARLCMVQEKPTYLKLLPRVWADLERNLTHPVLAHLAQICARLLPDPTPENIKKIGAQCGRHR
ncbi:MAG: aminoglycoside phosphotransferase family protein [Microgenomates group bacterium]